MCEEGLWILCHTTSNRILRCKGCGAESSESLLVNERTEILHIHFLNLLIFVAGAEAIEEVDERYAAFDCSKVGNSTEVHHFLYATFCQHSEARLAASHHVAVVTEDAEAVRSQGTCANMENAREQLSCNLVHIRNHQQQTLRCSERTCQGTSLQRTMNGTCGTSLGLHFLYVYCVAEEVLAALSGPFVHMLSHRAGRRNGVDCGNLAEHIRNMSSGLVTIHRHKLFCHNF